MGRLCDMCIVMFLVRISKLLYENACNMKSSCIQGHCAPTNTTYMCADKLNFGTLYSTNGSLLTTLPFVRLQKHNWNSYYYH